MQLIYLMSMLVDFCDFSVGVLTTSVYLPASSGVAAVTMRLQVPSEAEKDSKMRLLSALIH